MSREMPLLLKQYPSIGTMVAGRKGDLLLLNTPADGCTFVQSDNRCRIEMERGKAGKPLGCILFPFNNLSRLDNTFIVAPHFACPLSVHVPSRVGAVEGTHERIAGVLQQSGVFGEKMSPAWVRTLKPPRSHPAAELINNEVRFLDACTAALSTRGFVEVLESEHPDKKAFRDFQKRISRLLTWRRKTAGRDHFDDVMLAIASSLRIPNIGRSPEYQLRFLWLLETYAREFYADSTATPSPRAVNSLLQHSMSMIHLLAHEDAILTPRARKIEPLGSAELVFAATVAVRRMKNEGVLTALENSLGGLPSRADRLAVLSELARVPYSSRTSV